MCLGTVSLVVAGLGLAAVLSFWFLRRRLRQLQETIEGFQRGVSTQPLLPSRSLLFRDIERSLYGLANSYRERLAEAQRQRGLLEATLRSMHEGVLVLDSRGDVLLSNEQAQRCFGERNPLTGRSFFEIARDPELLAMVRNTLERGQPGGGEVMWPNGPVLSLRLAPITTNRENEALYVVVARDVTETKRLETARRDFVANVSHELRTPLTAIRGFAETLLAGALNDPDRARHFVSVIERHADRLSRLVDDLLVLSNLELKRTPLRLAAVDVPSIVRRTVETMGSIAQAAEVRLCTSFSPSVPPAWADSDRLEQVLVNLVDNAVKFTPTGGSVTVTVQVSTQAVGTHVRGPKPEGPWVEICVQDTGIGIPHRDLPRLTERFFRVDRARSREMGGTGLGLAIVKHIVQAHGGALRIESELGHGTSVHVYLPIAEGCQ